MSEKVLWYDCDTKDDQKYSKNETKSLKSAQGSLHPGCWHFVCLCPVLNLKVPTFCHPKCEQFPHFSRWGEGLWQRLSRLANQRFTHIPPSRMKRKVPCRLNFQVLAEENYGAKTHLPKPVRRIAARWTHVNHEFDSKDPDILAGNGMLKKKVTFQARETRRLHGDQNDFPATDR